MFSLKFSRSRILVRTAGVAVVLVATLGGATAVANAAGGPPAMPNGCGSRCDGKDPQTYRVALEGREPVYCKDDVKTVRTKGDVELRYSPYCRTAWARVTGGSPGWGYSVRVESIKGGDVRKHYEGGTWSDMVNDAGLKARACLYSRPSAEHDMTRQYCTDTY